MICQKHYWPGLILNSSQPFQSEDAAIGVYRRKGYFHAPSRPKGKLAEFFVPDVDTRLDRAEIEAVMEVVDHYVSPGIYTVILNTWGLGLPDLIENASHVELFNKCADVGAEIEEVRIFHLIHNLFCRVVFIVFLFLS